MAHLMLLSRMIVITRETIRFQTLGLVNEPRFLSITRRMMNDHSIFTIMYDNFFKDDSSYLRILQTEFLSQFLAVRLADVLLYLKPLLKAASLEIRENRSSHHSSARLSTRVRRPWKYQAGAREIAQSALDRTWKRCPATWSTRMMTSSSGTRHYRLHMFHVRNISLRHGRIRFKHRDVFLPITIGKC